ncbi:MAG TPA: bifunctional 3,4-dihydroxy-2-butanone-4-phosphate synthase/GTP cyclohydrolase II, partial [Gammaproteobacteria bacterium]|nr:bifunctional 3,4-dihydroxy-2-butanone-4-phosphate synthase/GTP cyclohydrolase II [Gammaproteobacteria bacterium]
GDIEPDSPVLVRVHLENPICDLTGSLRNDCGWPVRDVLQRVSREEAGVIVILCNQYEPEELINQLKSYSDRNEDDMLSRKQETRDLRTIGLGAQILSDVGVRKMRVLSAPKKIHAISGFGLEVVEYVS